MPQTPPAATKGPVHKVPCPWCKHPMDFRAHVDESMGGVGWGDQGLERGARVDCDHCGKTSKVADVEKLTVITLQPA